MKKNHVMVIDDDSYSIELYNMIVSWTSYKAFFKAEEDALKALDDLKNILEHNTEEFPDYILLDLKMPDIHGFDFIREFEKRFPGQKNKTKFIITTSSVIPREKEEAMTFDSVENYIIKPIPANLIEKLITEGINHDIKNR